MSALVEIWESEFTKLTEKVQLKKLLQLKAKRGEENDEGQVEEKKKVVKEKREVHQTESTLSEATVCLLMDRFVPW